MGYEYFFLRSSFKNRYQNSKIGRPIFPNISSIKQQHLQNFLHLKVFFFWNFKKRIQNSKIINVYKIYWDYGIKKQCTKFCWSRSNRSWDTMYLRCMCGQKLSHFWIFEKRVKNSKIKNSFKNELDYRMRKLCAKFCSSTSNISWDTMYLRCMRGQKLSLFEISKNGLKIRKSKIPLKPI